MRLFLAIDFPDDVKARIADNVDIMKKYIPKGVKWVDKKNLHVTFKFLGDVNERILDDIHESVDRVTPQHTPFTIAFKNAEIIPNSERPRLIWYDMEDEQGSAAKLFKDIDRTLYDLGFQREKRPLALHTTLGRVKFAHNIAWNDIFQQLVPVENIVDCHELSLFKSTLTPSGPIYSIITNFTLHNIEKNGGTI